jgi:hypothetical protein
MVGGSQLGMSLVAPCKQAAPVAPAHCSARGNSGVEVVGLCQLGSLARVARGPSFIWVWSLLSVEATWMNLHVVAYDLVLTL